MEMIVKVYLQPAAGMQEDWQCCMFHEGRHGQSTRASLSECEIRGSSIQRSIYRPSAACATMVAAQSTGTGSESHTGTPGTPIVIHLHARILIGAPRAGPAVGGAHAPTGSSDGGASGGGAAAGAPGAGSLIYPIRSDLRALCKRLFRLMKVSI